MSIQLMPLSERPREKAKLFGIEFLNNYELVAIILGSGTKKFDALEIARNLIDSSGSIVNFSNLRFDELINFEGVNTAKALKILASLELSKRISNSLISFDDKVTNVKKFIEKYKSILNCKNHEKMWVFGLDGHNKIKCYFSLDDNFDNINISKENIVKKLLAFKCKKYLICHNHLSQVEPSLEDVAFTDNLEKYSTLFNLKILDHIIIYEDKIFSFFENNLL